MSNNKNLIQDAIYAIGGMFIWDDSIKGQDYWEEVDRNLEAEKDRYGRNGSGGVDPNDI